MCFELVSEQDSKFKLNELKKFGDGAFISVEDFLSSSVSSSMLSSRFEQTLSLNFQEEKDEKGQS